MKRHIITVLSLAIMLLASKAFAWQQVYDITVTDYEVDYDKNICTFTIDRDHPVTTKTKECNYMNFSWQCSEGDKDYRMAQGIAAHKGSPIHLRYSEYACHPYTENMLLLSTWSGYHMCDK